MSRKNTLKGSSSARRRFLSLASMTGVSVALGACSNNSGSVDESPDCVLTPTAIEGPFYSDLNLVRQDITDGKPGITLGLNFTVVDATSCQPIPNAIVDIWHADATGLYSAFERQGDDQSVDTSSESFLRGEQTTDANGLVTFNSIYPGWYPGRTTHIHLKVIIDNTAAVTTQLFFPDSVSNTVYKTAQYLTRGEKDTSNGQDSFGGNVDSLLMSVVLQGSSVVASHKIGIRAT